jgi:CRP-like cAMP-binding protein
VFKNVLGFLSDPGFAKQKEFLKSLTLFQDLNFRDLGYVLQSLYSRVYEPGEPLFVEGDVGRALFILETGHVEVLKRVPKGEPQRIAFIQPGEFFGEMALLEPLPRTATAVAAERSQVHLLYRTRLDSLLHYHPRIGASIMSHLAVLLAARLRKARIQTSRGADSFEL